MRDITCNKKVKIVIFSLLTISTISIFFAIKYSSKENVNDLINITTLSEEFMEEYFEEYNELEVEEKENMLIVISSETINEEEYGASEVVEGPNNKYYLTFDDDVTRENAINQLSKEESIKSVEENVKRELYVDDNTSYNSWGIRSMGLDKAISMVSGNNEVVVAILDTGLDIDLFNKYYPGRLKGTYNVLPEDEDISMYDNYGHGTHIAGTIAEGTPLNVKILPVKITDFASMYMSDILAALEYVTYYTDVDVINMSFGGAVYSEAEYQAIEAARQKNIIAVAAAGNDNTLEPSYPAAFDNTISIASVDENLMKSDFSNYGPYTTFAAPGGQINSLMASYMALSSNADGDDDHETISGTSMATPHAVAATAILKSFNKNLSLENVIDLLKNNITDLGAYGYDYYYGHGLINFNDAIKCSDNVTLCDEFNIFKVYESEKMTISEVKFTNYNYGTITNLLLSTVDFSESDGYNYQKQLWQLDDMTITGYDPYSTETQTVTIKYLDYETTVDVKNPDDYELGWEYTINNEFAYLSGYKDSDSEINKLYIPNKINDVIIKGILNSNDESSNLFYNSSDASYFNEIIIPEGIEYIGDYAFSGMKNIGKITIKNPVIDVGSNSFANMPFLNIIIGNITLSENSHNVFKDNLLLEEINISNLTTIIPIGAFENCKLLQSIIIPNSVTTIDDYAFKNSGLSNVILPNQLKRVGNEAFKGAKLSNLILPDSLETIGNYSFSGNMIESIELPKNVNSIGLAPFSGNYILNIVVSSENTHYDSRDNSNLIIETSTNKIIQGSIKSVIPSSVLIIGEESYSELNEPPGSDMLIETSRLLVSLEIPDGVTTIEKNAFLNTHYLEKVIVPRSVISIDPTLFKEHASKFGKTVLWAYQDSYAYEYAINNNCTYVVIENSSVAELVEGIGSYFDDRTYYPYETVDFQGIEYYYWDYEKDMPAHVDIPNYTISYQNGDSFRYGDDKFYVNFSIENGQQNVTVFYNVVVEKKSIQIPTINLLIGESIIDIVTRENGFGLSIENGTLYFNNTHQSFDKAGDYTVKGYFISNNSDYSNMWDIDIPIHVINKQYIKNEIKINTKIADGTTYIDPDTVALVDVDKSYYTIVSAYLNSADYIGNDAEATVKIRLNDNIYENYAFTGNQQELEQTVKMTVIDFEIPEINLLIGEEYYQTCFDDGCLKGYGTNSFEEPGDYTIMGYYSYNDGSDSIEDILIPVHVINKRIVYEWAEVSPKEYDGTTNIDFNTITLFDVDKSQYTIISAELDSPDVNEWGMAKIKVKLNDTFYENYAFTGNKQESEWFNPIKITKGTPQYDVPTNLKVQKGKKLSEVSLPDGFEWINENEILDAIGKKTYKAKYIPKDTNNYKIVEDIDITIEILDNVIEYTITDYSGIYDGKEHSINIDINLTDYEIKYSINNTEYNLNELPKFKEVGEYTINYKITKTGYEDIIGSNKINIYGIKEFDASLIVKNGNILIKDNNYSDIIHKINTHAIKTEYSHYDKDNKLVDNGIAKTGDILKIKLNEIKDYKYTLGVIGDVSGDGAVNSADLLKMRQHLIGTQKAIGVYYLAADITYDDAVNSADLLRLRQHLLGIKTIS